jgi:hypothetical protein
MDLIHMVQKSSRVTRLGANTLGYREHSVLGALFCFIVISD